MSTTPANPLTRIDSFSFRTLLCRRLHHRPACARSGGLARRGFATESAVTPICRESGGCVATNRLIRDLDLAVPNPGDLRRIEVIVGGLWIFWGAQLAVDATMVSPVRADGLPSPGAAAQDGVPSPQLVNANNGLILSCQGATATETGGRWSLETHSFLRALAWDRARATTPTQESGTGMADAVVVHPFVHCDFLCPWWTLGEGLGLMVPSLPRTKWRLNRFSRASCDFV